MKLLKIILELIIVNALAITIAYMITGVNDSASFLSDITSISVVYLIFRYIGKLGVFSTSNTNFDERENL